MRLFRALTLLITEDDAGVGIKLFDDGKQLSRDENAATFVDVHNDGKLKVTNANGLVTVPFGDVTTAKAILLAPSGPVTFRINGGTVDFPLGAPATGRGMLYWEGDITGIQVSNPDGTSTVSVLYAIAGVE
jgi:hypothetical protein